MKKSFIPVICAIACFFIYCGGPDEPSVSATQTKTSVKETSDQPQKQNPKKSLDEENQKETVVENEVEAPPMNNLGPMASIKHLDKKIESYHLGDDLTPEQKEENRKLKAEIIRGTFDIRELCRLALSKHWKEITSEQQNQIVRIMTELLEKKAIFSRERLSGKDKYYDIRYLSEKISKNDNKQSLVKTELRIPRRGLTISIQYKLLKTEWGWKIFDVIVDESSMLLNYRSAFHNVITKYGFEELVSRMQKKLDEIK